MLTSKQQLTQRLLDYLKSYLSAYDDTHLVFFLNPDPGPPLVLSASFWWAHRRDLWMLLGDRRGLHQLLLLIFPSHLCLQPHPPPSVPNHSLTQTHTVSLIPSCLSVVEVMMSGWAAVRVGKEGGRAGAQWCNAGAGHWLGWKITISRARRGEGGWEMGEEEGGEERRGVSCEQ